MSHPDAATLLAAVEEHLAGLAGRLHGRDGFHARVAANAVAIVRRELDAGPDAVEAAALAPYGGAAQLCADLRAGRRDPRDPSLLGAVRAAVLARLAVDNPRYPTLERLAGRPVPLG